MTSDPSPAFAVIGSTMPDLTAEERADKLVDGDVEAFDSFVPVFDRVDLKAEYGVCEGGSLDCLNLTRAAYKFSIAAAIRSAELDAERRGAEREREECAKAADAWSKPSVVQLAAGELNAEELRTAQAIARGIASAIRQRTP